MKKGEEWAVLGNLLVMGDGGQGGMLMVHQILHLLTCSLGQVMAGGGTQCPHRARLFLTAFIHPAKIAPNLWLDWG